MAKKTSAPKTKKKAPQPPVDLSCGKHKSDCDRVGWACSAMEGCRGSSFACNKHVIVGTEKPFVGRHLCRVCAKLQQRAA